MTISDLTIILMKREIFIMGDIKLGDILKTNVFMFGIKTIRFSLQLKLKDLNLSKLNIYVIREVFGKAIIRM